ncbi:MAG: helical backbone metal receptor, partial [Gammaproteobacteria bacterium]|nr:helical backbone metal receptor [Gammaproteobacteria bacterium]
MHKDDYLTMYGALKCTLFPFTSQCFLRPTFGIMIRGMSRRKGWAVYALYGPHGGPYDRWAVPTIPIFLITTVVGWLGACSFCNAEQKSDAAPQRVITIAPNAAEIICALGACDRIIAVSKFCVYPPELKGREKIGGLFDPDLEKIVALRPDLFVLRGHNEAIVKLCSERGIELYHDRTDTLGDVERTIAELGVLFGKENEATKLVATMSQQINTIRRRGADQTKPRVLLVYARQPDRLANLL